MPFRIGYQRLPADPEAHALAERLKAAQVATKAARRIDDFERLQTQYHEHRKAQLKLVLGACGLLLGTAPGLPGVYGACRDDGGWPCALRLGAIVGAAMALGTTLWSGWDLSRNPVRFHTQSKKLSEELARAMQCRTGEVAVDDLFTRYQRFGPEDRAILKERLHEAAGEPKPAVRRWRQVGDALGMV